MDSKARMLRRDLKPCDPAWSGIGGPDIHGAEAERDSAAGVHRQVGACIDMALAGVKGPKNARSPRNLA